MGIWKFISQVLSLSNMNCNIVVIERIVWSVKYLTEFKYNTKLQQLLG